MEDSIEKSHEDFDNRTKDPTGFASRLFICSLFYCTVNAEISPVFCFDVESAAATNSDFAEVQSRLQYFRQANGSLRKGTFIVLKDEAIKAECSCSLWRVDNQNLLQKYLPFKGRNDQLIYKNSSTVIKCIKICIYNYLACF